MIMPGSLERIDPRWIGVVASLLLSIWVILTNDTINVDGILYLDAAHQIKQGNWREAIELYRWLFYPMLVAFISKITFLELETCANIISTAFFTGIIWIFLSILKELNAPKVVITTGLLIICVHPYINEYRADVSRDAGFWFFFLWSTSALIKLEKKGGWQDALTWGFSISLATLFRIDGAVYALLAPAILLFNRDMAKQSRMNNYFKAMSLPAVLGLSAFIGILTGLMPAGRLPEIGILLGRLVENITVTIPDLGEVLVEHVLNRHSSDFGVAGIYAIFITIFILMVIKRSTILLLAAGCYTLFNKSERIKVPHIHILIWLAILNLSTLLIFVISRHFLSSRFAMPTALIVGLLAAFSLAKLFQKKNRTLNFKIKTVKVVTIFLLVTMTLDGLVSFGHSKRYMRDAGYWLEDNLKESETLISNHLLIRHYAGRRNTASERKIEMDFSAALKSGSHIMDFIKRSNYIAISSKNIRPETLSYVEKYAGKPVMTFSDARKNTILIFYRSADKPSSG